MQLATVVELKNDADVRCDKITSELHHLQVSTTVLQSQHSQLQQRCQDMLDSQAASESSLKKGVDYLIGQHPANERRNSNSNNSSNNSSTTTDNNDSNPSTLLLQQELGEAYSCVDEATQAMTVLQGTQAQLTEALRQADEENKALLLRLQQRDEELTVERSHRTSLEQQLTTLHQGSVSVAKSGAPNDSMVLTTTTAVDESTIMPNTTAFIETHDRAQSNAPVKSDRALSDSSVKSDRAESNSTAETTALLVSSQATEITALNHQVYELTEALGIARQQQQQQQQQQLQQQQVQQQQGYHQQQQQQQQQQEKQKLQLEQQQRRRMQELEDSLSVGANRALMMEQVSYRVIVYT